MDLQTIFYTLGIIFMVISLLLLITVTVVLAIIAKKVSRIYSSVKEVVDHPQRAASAVGAAVAGSALSHLPKLFGLR